ncbi:stage II sporulation protein E [Clostridiaceae bacterium 14S0207]|nr:stage II sporulation protein E [Clostridiaceae bacterium 14S0207]
MQYGIQVLPYKRVKKEKEEERENSKINIGFIKQAMLYSLVCLLISRVKLINGMAPFGIAMLMVFSLYINKQMFLVASIGSMLGYFSLMPKIQSVGNYLICIGGLLILNYFINKESRKKKVIAMFFMIFIEFIATKIIFSKMNLSLSVFYAVMEGLCIIPLYYIMNKGILCFKSIDNKKLFDNEETISMGIVISLILAGTWGVSFKSISLMNILGLYFVCVVGFTCGSSVGGGVGVVLGSIVGMTSLSMPVYIAVFGVCGLISGVFRDTGKYFSGIAYAITFFIMQIYLGVDSSFLGFELLASMALFMITPKKIYNRICLEFNVQEKKEDLNDGYMHKIRGLYDERLNKFSNLLFNISYTLDSLVDNEKLEMKGKSSALVENLADRVCCNCNMKSICWKQEMHYTYSAFMELIQNYQENNFQVPYEIERKCVNRTALMKNTEDIVNKYIIHEMKRSSLCEGRELLSKQIKNMGETVKNIGGEIQDNIYINIELENKLKRILDKNRVKYKDILCIKDERKRDIVKLILNSCGGKKYCSKDALAYVNQATGYPMYVCGDSCLIDKANGTCNVTYEKIPKFQVSSYVAIKCKDGEKCSGDSYSANKLDDGTYTAIISDGMGSGPQASRESKASVQLINEFCKNGFSKITAINAINSIMSMKFSETEKFSTLDLCNIDLYTGRVEFMKVGAVDSFLKKANDVEVIKSKSLPIGVLDTADIEIEERKVDNGDIIVMVSDGVLDYNDDSILNEKFIKECLKSIKSNEPKEIACEVLNKALKLREYKVKDDMTVLACKVYGVY